MSRRKSGPDPTWSRVTAFEEGIEEGIKQIREELGDAIYIIKEELDKTWITEPAANALHILVNFVNEEDDDTEA